ncbi:hypothetical protein KIPB_002522, partial [Kipferlia bialata]|eukprot:g2522.t1
MLGLAVAYPFMVLAGGREGRHPRDRVAEREEKKRLALERISPRLIVAVDVGQQDGLSIHAFGQPSPIGDAIRTIGTVILQDPTHTFDDGEIPALRYGDRDAGVAPLIGHDRSVRGIQ